MDQNKTEFISENFWLVKHDQKLSIAIKHESC